MVTSARFPNSISLYRGQSRTGIGEGPEAPISHGEQYLDAEGGLGQNAALLTEIRPWMTLDFDPADQRELAGKLESWSVFRRGNLFFVARLVSAGIYDRRVAYFAHGRAWPTGSWPPGFDPGILLGLAEAFEEPWRDRVPGTHTFSALDEAAYKVRRLEMDEAPVVARFLAHLFQAMENRQRLVVAVPVSEFAIGGSLPGLLGLARAALPRDLKDRCTLRVYTQTPERFLQPCDLMAIPDSRATDAMRLDRHAVLLDQTGECHSGQRLDDRVRRYAEAVLDRTKNAPAGLLYFSERYADLYRQEQSGWPPDPSEARELKVIYNIAYGLSTVERRGALLNRFLSRQSARLPWRRLILKREWASFPDDSLAEFLLDVRDLAADGLQAWADESLPELPEERRSKIRSEIHSRLAAWWDEGRDKRKQLRLLRLFSDGLIAHQEASRFITDIPLTRIEHFGLLHEVLRAEAKAGALGKRAQQAVDLARIAQHDSEVSKVLTEATSQGQLPPDWVEYLMVDPPPQNLFHLAGHLMHNIESWPNWRGIPERVFDHFLQTLPESGLWHGIFWQGNAHFDALLEHPTVLLRLLELGQRVAPHEIAKGAFRARSLEGLSRIVDPQSQQFVLEKALDPEWYSLSAETLVPEADRLQWPWLEDYVETLLASAEVRDRLSTPKFFDLAARTTAGELRLQRVISTANQRIDTDHAETTAALVASGWWPSWRRHMSSDPRRAALGWLSCPYWQQSRQGGALDRETVEATLETWNQVVLDLGSEGLPSEQIEALCGERRPPWPWIRPFERQQVADLGVLATDIDALVALVEGLPSDQVPLEPNESVADLVLTRKENTVSANALLWLVDSQDHEKKLSPLGVIEARDLYERTKRKDAARNAFVEAILDQLRAGDELSLDALHEAGKTGELDLWSGKNPKFHNGLAAWMMQWDSVAGLGGPGVEGLEIARLVTKKLQLDVGHEVPVPTDPERLNRLKRLVKDLDDEDFSEIANFLSPQWDLDAQVIQALMRGKHDAPCWKPLTESILNWRTEEGEHRFLRIARTIRNRIFTVEETRALRKNAWPTLARVASSKTRRRIFMMELSEPLSSEPRPLPIFELMASIMESGTSGQLAVKLAVTSAGEPWRVQESWWRALLVSLVQSRRSEQSRSSPKDRPDMALAVVLSYWDLYRNDEQEAFRRVLASIQPVMARSLGLE